MAQASSHPVRLWSRLDSYIGEQLLNLFGMTLALCSVVLFFSDTLLDLLKEVHKFALPVSVVLRQLVLYFPLAISLAIPASVFLAVLLAYNSLNQQFELIALRIHGISLRRLMVPALALGLLGAGLDYVVTNHVVPWAQYRSNMLKLEALNTDILPNEQNQFTYVLYNSKERLDKIIYVGKTENKILENVVFIDLSAPEAWQVVQAMKGRVSNSRWLFENANIYEIFRKGTTLGFSHIGQLEKRNLLQANDKLDELKRKLSSYKTKTIPEFWHFLHEQQRKGKPASAKTYIKFWERLTLPLSCLALALVAVPFAMTRPRVGAEKGFIFALLSLLGFYVIRSLAVALGKTGFLTFGGLVPLDSSYAIAAWLPIVIMLALASALIVQKNKVL